jgi:DNA polymerase IIIc chi subunit
VQWSLPVFADFSVSTDLLQDTIRLEKEAIASLRNWDAWVGPAACRVRFFVPKRLQKKAGDLIGVVYASGVQAWVWQLFAAPCVIRSRQELAAWCRLQFAVLERYARAYQPDGELWPLIPVKGGTLPHKDATDIAVELVTATLNPNSRQHAEAIKKLNAMPNVEFQRVRRVEGVIPKQARCEKLVHQAWKYMRALGKTWPVAPAEVPNADAARRCLDQVVEWCAQVETGSGAPAFPDTLQGEVSKQEFKILKVLWDKRKMAVDRLCETVWQNPVTDEAVIKAVRRLGKRLLGLNVQGISVNVKNGVVVLERFC